MGRAFMIKYGNGLVWYRWEEFGLLLRRVVNIEGSGLFCSVHGIGIYYYISNDAQKHKIKLKL
jgi:hypothetical protein